MDQNVRAQILEELLRRLGGEDQFARVAERAGVPIISLPGESPARHYEQMIDRLWKQGPEALQDYLEAAATEAGGGFEIRYALTRGASGWDLSEMRTAMIRLPPPELLDAALQASRSYDPSLEATTVDTSRARPVEPGRAPELDAMERTRARRDVGPPPVGWLDRSVEIPSLSERLKEMAAEMGAAAERLDLGGILPDDRALKLREARFVVNIGGDGTRGTLRLSGEGFRAPMFLELEGLPGNRLVERVRPLEAFALLTERDRAELMKRRLRVVRGTMASGWTTVLPGGHEHSGEPWPAFPPEAAYVPAGEYRLPGETARRQLDRGILIGLSAVTNRDMINFVQRTGYVPERSEEFLKHYRPEAFPEQLWDHPVIYVSQTDALAYCRWVGGTLPAVEAWERAAVGISGPDYPWGMNFDRGRINSRETRRGWTTPVRSFPEGRGSYGHFNLAGNVWEWTSTPAGDEDHAIMKGGSWVNDRRCAQNGFRSQHRRELRSFYIGFRVAWDLPAGLVG